ncbi:hypothetical protein B0T19DRAFT_287600 [Cercophora scortea]|uniref:DUF7924 domain-containing protein n=1 Tax=Cercophora scortea TaxID=314031 RepID=A0AAE0I2Y7_9PEZI|nr:hypothetical protein B0T19DRAFT_287600 [Cercophora scortea]
MARQEKRKRPLAESGRLSLEIEEQPPPPKKKIKSARKRSSPPNFSPEFWDNLSRVWLTPRALRELDRRNKARLSETKQPLPTPSVSTNNPDLDLVEFAKHGGPDLRHLQGCPEPKEPKDEMASKRSTVPTGNRKTKSTKPTKSTAPTTVPTQDKRSSAYPNDFEEHMVDNQIYPIFYDFPDDHPPAEPDNLDETRQMLSTSRPSLSPSLFAEADFQRFRKVDRTNDEATVMQNVLPIIAGNPGPRIRSASNLHFTNIKSITNEATVKLVPDSFDGARRSDVERQVKKDLNDMIIPTKHFGAPIVPNFFIEAKSPSGRNDIAERQALHDGAIGARAMHSLQSYGQDEPVYDGNAYTYSSTYHTDTVRLYAHHVTPAAAPGDGPEYHMTQLRAVAITDSREAFAQGASAFRNLRDLAQQHRDNIIQGANAKARNRSNAQPVVDLEAAEGDEYEESGAGDFVNGDDNFEPGEVDMNGDYYAADSSSSQQPVDEPSAIPQYLSNEYQEYGYQSSLSPTAAGPSGMSLSTDLTSPSNDRTQARARSKRTSAARSPPSATQPRKKKVSSQSRTPRHSASRRPSAAGPSTALAAIPEQEY